MNKVTLRPYQVRAQLLLQDSWARGNKRIIFCLPTGGGKTVTFSSLAVEEIAAGGRVLIITDRAELLGQAGNTLIRSGLDPFLISAKKKYLTPSACYVAMVETLNNRMKRPSFRMALGKITLIIIDEAHKGNFAKVVELFPDTNIVGATATPVPALSKIYQDIVEPVRISELIQEGYLVNCRTFGAKEEVKNLKVVAGEYTDKSLIEAFDKRSMYDGVIENYMKLSAGKKALCFNINIEHSKHMNAVFQASGIRSAHLDGEMDEHTRNRIFAEFKAGDIDILNNVGVATTGYDEPSIQTIIINRKTKSLPLYMQMTGRGSRLYTGKSHFTIIDMGSNFLEHGLWNEDVDWCSIFRNESKKKAGVAPVRTCPSCEKILSLNAKVCDECGHVFAKVKEEPKVITSEEFVEVNTTLPEHLNKSWTIMSVEELEELRLHKKYKVGFVLNQLRDRTSRELMEFRQQGLFKDNELREAEQSILQNYFSQYADLKGYKPGWVHHQIKERSL